jgi:hypothetical protein
VAAVLGVGATLWATLVGQSVRDVLRSQDPVKAFRSSVDSVCTLRFGSSSGTVTQYIDPRQNAALLRTDIDRLSAFFHKAPIYLAAIEPPRQYVSEYRALSDRVAELAGATSDPSLRRVAFETGNARAARRLRQDLRTTSDLSSRAVKPAVMMQVDDCARMFEGVGTVADIATIISKRSRPGYLCCPEPGQAVK